ncbi:MAG: cistern family PEP-CTERM protein [Cyanobacteria bacterium J06555_13]
MKSKMKMKALLLPLTASAGALAFGLATTPAAKAYTVTPNGRTAGNPVGQQLYDINLDSQNDVGRVLDAASFSLGAGTANKQGKVLTQAILGKAVIEVVNVTQSLLSIKLDVTNDTKNSDTFKASLVSLWFGLKESVTSLNVTDAAGNSITQAVRPANGKAPGGFTGIDVCLFGSVSCKSGGPINGGLLGGGNVDSFTIDIGGNFDIDGDGISTATISDLGAKWRTNNGTYSSNYVVAGVPEPITILGSGAALAFGAFMKRRTSKQSAQ